MIASANAAAANSGLIGRLRARIATMIADARARASLRQELAHLDANGELDGVLAEIGLSRAGVPVLVKRHPGAYRRLAAMLQRRGLADCRSRNALARSTVRAEMRDIEAQCLFCQATRKCETWLASGQQEGYREFCPNSEAMDRIKAARGPAPSPSSRA